MQLDADGNATVSIAPSGQHTTMVEDALDRTVQVTDPNGDNSYTLDNADDEDVQNVDALGDGATVVLR